MKECIDTNGYVGGTTNQDKKLEIFNGALKFGTSTAGLNEFELFPTDEGLNGLGFYDRTNGAYRMLISNDGKVGIGTASPSALLSVFSTGASSSVMRVVRSTSAANQSNYLFNITEESDNNSTLDMQAANGISAIRLRTSGDSYFNGGNVGIGTTGPSTKLSIEGTEVGTNLVANNPDASIKIRNKSDTDGNFASLDFYNSTNYMTARIGANFIDAGDRDTALFFATRKNDGNLAHRMIIDEDGNVGIGTAGPGHQLEVACDSSEYNVYAITEHNGAGWGGLVGGKMEYTMSGSSSASSRTWSMGKYRPTDTVHPATTIILKSRDNGTAFLWMDDTNVLRFGTSSSNVGSSTGTSLGTALTTSDERAKNIESGFEYGLDHVMQLQPIAFAFKKDAKQTRTLGFGASASQEIIPESVFDTGNCIDGYDEHPEHEGMNQPKSDDTELGMDYVQLIPVLTKAIQEQQQIIEGLKAQNESLIQRIEILENK